MSYRTILAVIDDGSETDQIMDVGSMLANSFGSHLVGVHVEPVEKGSLVAALDLAYVEALSSGGTEQALRIERHFLTRATSEGLSYDLHSLSESDRDTFEMLARTCDLIVARQPDDGASETKRDRVDALVFDSGRPVLVVPYIQKRAAPVRRVVVAWNGTREAARATFDALPFLMAANRVDILTVEAGKGDRQPGLPSGAELARALSRHGVSVVLVREVADRLPASQVILNRLAETGAELLVMGAYSRAPWREHVFGGVTRDMLDATTALTLMSR